MLPRVQRVKIRGLEFGVNFRLIIADFHDRFQVETCLPSASKSIFRQMYPWKEGSGSILEDFGVSWRGLSGVFKFCVSGVGRGFSLIDAWRNLIKK